MSPDVLRRKLVKKMQRRKYKGKCPNCGGRVNRRVVWNYNETFPMLIVSCEGHYHPRRIEPCGYQGEIYWTGKPG